MLKLLYVDKVIRVFDLVFYITCWVKRQSHSGQVCGGDLIAPDDHTYDKYINKSLGNALWWFAIPGQIFVWVLTLFCIVLVIFIV